MEPVCPQPGPGCSLSLHWPGRWAPGARGAGADRVGGLLGEAGGVRAPCGEPVLARGGRGAPTAHAQHLWLPCPGPTICSSQVLGEGCPLKTTGGPESASAHQSSRAAGRRLPGLAPLPVARLSGCAHEELLLPSGPPSFPARPAPTAEVLMNLRPAGGGSGEGVCCCGQGGLFLLPPFLGGRSGVADTACAHAAASRTGRRQLLEIRPVVFSPPVDLRGLCVGCPGCGLSAPAEGHPKVLSRQK